MNRCKMCQSPSQHQPGCPMDFAGSPPNIEPGFAGEIRDEEPLSFGLSGVPCFSDDY